MLWFFSFLPLPPGGPGGGVRARARPIFLLLSVAGRDAPHPKVPKVPETVGRPRMRLERRSPPSDVHRGLTGVGAGVRKAGFAFCRRPRKGSGPARDTADGIGIDQRGRGRESGDTDGERIGIGDRVSVSVCSDPPSVSPHPNHVYYSRLPSVRGSPSPFVTRREALLRSRTGTGEEENRDVDWVRDG